MSSSSKRLLGTMVTAAVVLASVRLFSAIQLTQVVGGLSAPLFVGHAGDGTNRLFIVEQGGIIKVLQPGATTPTVFLNISSKVTAGGERGLLGLAFHPFYEVNGRFFVYYTRSGDGALVIAEYHVSGNPNVAGPAETILITIPHPFNANHNGGMLAFGPDGYLYMGVGDGGAGNDPPNNAQQLGELLGKILRIDIDSSGMGVPYVSPPTNPFVNTAGARPEIFVYGMRNPWRFSFDRLTGAQWVADVGQGAFEEVDSPIVSGGNYGWRVWEGNFCTNNGPGPCITAGYIFPLFDYSHIGGRCSITGGYVYRGSQGAVQNGTYVYGDYCSGEIFGWDGSATALLLDTNQNISSFGEDEAGELYVVNLGGTVSRIVSTNVPCTYSIDPASQSFGTGGGTGTVSVTAGAGCGWTAATNASFIHVTSGGSGSGSGTVSYSVDTNPSSSSRSGTITIADQTFTINQAAVPCAFSIAPSSQNVGFGGESGSVSVTAAAGCVWTAISNASFIHVTAGSSGSGNGTVSYTVDANGSPSPRSGSITVAGQAFTVEQSGAIDCFFALSAKRATFDKGDATGSVNVIAPAGCFWTATATESWITITSGASGTGNGTVTYALAAYNNKAANRLGILTIAGMPFVVRQGK